MSATLADVHTRVRAQLRDQTQNVFSASDITNYANDWLEIVAAQSDAFWQTTTLSTTASTRTYSLATDFVSMIRVFYNDSFVLPQVSPSQLSTQTADITDTGTPQFYYLERNPTELTSQVMVLMGLYPVPSASSITIRYVYRFMPAKVTAWASRFPLPPGFSTEGVVAYVCWQLKKSDREFAEAEAYKREYLEHLGMLKRKLAVNPDEHRQMRADDAMGVEGFARFDPSVFAES